MENVRTHILIENFCQEDAVGKMHNLVQYMKDGKASVYYVCGAKNDRIAGMLWAHPYQIYGENRMHISAPIVVSEYRKKGYARQLYEALYQEMVQLNMKTVYTNVDEVNSGSKTFHYKLGFSDEIYQFVKNINQ